MPKQREVVARIDAQIKDKLLKRARRYRMDESEVIEQIQARKRATKKMTHLHPGNGRH